MAGNVEQYEQLSAYLDGELSEAQRAEAQRMLERDPAARRVLEELRRTARLVASLPRERLSVEKSALLQSQLEREHLLGTGAERVRMSWGRSSRVQGFKWVALAACIMVAFAGMYYAFTELQKERERRVFAVADREDAGRTSSTSEMFQDRGSDRVGGATADLDAARTLLPVNGQTPAASMDRFTMKPAASPEAAPEMRAGKDKTAVALAPVLQRRFEGVASSQPTTQPATSQPASQPTSQGASGEPRPR